MDRRGKDYLRHVPIVAMLMISLVLAYGAVRRNAFINFDDNEYVTENPHVRSGLTAEGVLWAFTRTHSSNWHPITWLSHMLDVELFGMDPGKHHLANLFYHTAATLALYWVVWLYSGAVWRSGFLAALFGLHPLHVESVAWISQRKDVLSGLLCFLILGAYLHYRRKRTPLRYTSVLLLLAAGLMTKPMLVTVPVLLLLLDYWPLNDRGELLPFGRNSAVEKIPHFLLALAAGLITYTVQSGYGAVRGWDDIAPIYRAFNAVISYVHYLLKIIVPRNLSVFYPHPGASIEGWKVLGALSLLTVISVLAIKVRASKPYVLFGWLWYIITLLPVIGLVQVGGQSLADRYSYIPSAGLFIIVAWWTGENAERNPVARRLAIGGVIVCLVGVIFMTRRHVDYWRDSVTLFSHAVQATEGNYVAYNNLGAAFMDLGRYQEAIESYSKSIASKPDEEEPHYNIAAAYEKIGDIRSAEKEYRIAVTLNAEDHKAHNNLGRILMNRGDTGEALYHLKRAVAIKPSYPEALHNLGVLMERAGNLEQAIRYYEESVKLEPSLVESLNNIGVIRYREGRLDLAAESLQRAIKADPTYADAYSNMGLVAERAAKDDEAIGYYMSALRLDSRHANAHYNLGNILAKKGDMVGAKLHYTEALRTRPGFAAARKKYEEISGLHATPNEP